MSRSMPSIATAVIKQREWLFWFDPLDEQILTQAQYLPRHNLGTPLQLTDLERDQGTGFISLRTNWSRFGLFCTIEEKYQSARPQLGKTVYSTRGRHLIFITHLPCPDPMVVTLWFRIHAELKDERINGSHLWI